MMQTYNMLHDRQSRNVKSASSVAQRRSQTILGWFPASWTCMRVGGWNAFGLLHTYLRTHVIDYKESYGFFSTSISSTT